MRSALITGVVVAAVVAMVGWGRALSNADFIYMCCAARFLADGGVPASGYFPPGYPALLWLAVQTGLSALSAGALLSALGTGLSASAIVWTARRLRLPAVLAIALGLLGASLPDVFEIAFNPHLDALYTGLALWLLALALAALAGDRRHGALIAMIAAAALLLTLRYHAVIVVAPVALVLALRRERAARCAGFYVLASAVISLGVVLGLLYLATGSLQSAAAQQIGTGAMYFQLGPQAAEHIFTNYDDVIGQMPTSFTAVALTGLKNAGVYWPDFLARRMVLLGLLLWIAAVLARRYPPRSHWLLLFITGYTLAVSVTYFTPRASALPELAALLLVVQSLAALCGGWLEAESRPVWLARPALTGLLVVLALAAAAYNGWRERAVLADWHAVHTDVIAANAQALKLASDARRQLYGPLDFTAWPLSGRYCLPGATYSRLWLDDPRVAHIVEPYIPRYTPREVASGSAPVGVILLWEHHRGRPSYQIEAGLLEALTGSWVWREQPAAVAGTRLWVRGP